MTNMFYAVGVAIGIVVLLPAADNLVFNPGFEMGTEGYALVRILRPDTNADLKYLAPNPDVSGGKSVLVIDNPYQEFFELHSREFELKEATKYTASLTAKATSPSQKLRLIVYHVSKDNQWTVFARVFTLTGEFQRYQFDFNTGNTGGFYHLQICPGQHASPDVPAGSVTLDDLTVAESGMTAPAKIQSTVVSARRLYTKEIDREADLVLKVVNPTAFELTQKVIVKGIDEYTKDLLFERSFELNIPPGGKVAIPFTIPLERYGSVRLKVDGITDSLDGFYTVIGRYTSHKLDFSKDFCVSMNGSTDYRLPPLTAYPGYVAKSGSLDDQFGLLAQMGLRLIRDHAAGSDAAAWHALEPAEGQWDDRHADYVLRLCDKYQMTLLPVIGRSYFIESSEAWEGQHWPPWLVAKCERVKEDPPNVMSSVRGKILLPPLELWRLYVRHFATLAKGKVPFYEITNEPNLFLADDVYMKYLKSASEEIRAADPQAKIIGLSVTSDHTGTIEDYTIKCLRQNALKYIDAVSFHPYASRELGSIKAADAQIDGFNACIAPWGKDVPVWNTELFYLFDIDEKVIYLEKERFAAHHAVKRFIIDLGEGVTQSMSVQTVQLWKPLLTPNLYAGDSRMELVPSENFAAYNVLARLFEGAEPRQKIKRPEGVIVYSFVKDNKPIAAVWNLRPQAKIFATFSGFEVMDLFGNAMHRERYLLADAPYFLTASAMDPAEFEQKLRQLPFELETVFAVSPVVRLVDASSPYALVIVGNRSDREINGLLGLTGNGFSAGSAVRFTLSPYASQTMQVPLKGALAPGELSVRLFGSGGNQNVTAKGVVAPAVTLGEIAEFNSADNVLHADFEFRRDQNDWLLTVTVKDATPSGVSGDRKMWEEDSVELFFDPALTQADLAHPGWYHDRTFRLFVMPRRDKAELKLMGRQLEPDMFPFDVRQTAGGYNLTVRIPGSLLRDRFGFDIKVNDADGTAKASRFASWSGSDKAFQDRTIFGIVQQP